MQRSIIQFSLKVDVVPWVRQSGHTRQPAVPRQRWVNVCLRAEGSMAQGTTALQAKWLTLPVQLCRPCSYFRLCASSSNADTLLALLIVQ